MPKASCRYCADRTRGRHMDGDKKILLVDADEKTSLKAGELGAEGFELRQARSMSEALRQISSFDPGIVCLDLGFPSLEPAAFCAGLKRSRDWRPLQVVLLSEPSPSGQLVDTLAAGADDFIGKPFEPLEFALRMRAARIRLLAQLRLYEEREYYRKAVRQEEDLTIKLLDRQLGLKETLADLEGKKSGLEEENSRLEALARYDPLTGLLNRRSLDARIEREIGRAFDEKAPLSGFMLDIDRFKAINDSKGHTAGDEALRAVGEAVKRCLRREDYAGRFGGDEMFAILPGAELGTAAGVAERVRSAVAETRLGVGEVAFSVSVSIGAASWRPGDEASLWISRADSALYKAKRLGRNRVEI